MKTGFYLKTAWSNIRKNYRFYIPQILTGMGLLACLYIVYTLKVDERIREVRGGDYLPYLMSIGLAVLSLLSIILILYTNSFLMRQRKHEYGLYNVLGIEKRHIGKILFWETAISGLASIISGVAFGILFYKLCSLLICNILQSEIILGFDYITYKTIIPVVLFFIIIYLVAFIINRISIAKMKPVEMLASRRTGEKEPKVKWAIFIIGLFALIGGYVISIVTESPLEAILLFFVAVFLVIIGTYFLFTAGSIFVLKCLKKNKNYYYNSKHMPSVSGLLYRMKQNAVGLASICILASCVLVLISTTVSLYSGMQETLDSNYPEDLYASACYITEDDEIHSIPGKALEDIVKKSAEKYGVKIKKIQEQKFLEVAYLFDGEKFNVGSGTEYDLEQLANVTYITEDTYNHLAGEALNLKPDEVAVCVIGRTIGTTKEPKETVTLHGKTFKVKKKLTYFPIQSSMAMITPSCYGIVVSDDNVLNELYLAQKRDYANAYSEIKDRVAVVYEDRDLADKFGKEMQDDIFNGLDEYIQAQPEGNGALSGGVDSFWDAKDSIIGMYGSLLFLGIILGIACMFATVLIIYYKQISEGYEDRERYQIMKKVGMSDGEVKKTIRSQTLLVFFLPLVSAGIHTVFVFPILNRLLHLLLLSRTSLFIICTAITFAIFAIIYIIIYSLTARTYYKIVH